MEDLATFLLQLYQAARACEPDAFQALALERLQESFAFAGAFWGAGRFTEGGRRIVPTSLHSRHLDPDFLTEWSQVQQADPIPGRLLAAPGTALRVHVPSYYAPTPVLASLGERYRIRSMTVIAMPSPDRGALEWLSLYRDHADAVCSDREGRWLEAVAPHLAEAGQINRLLHGGAADGDTRAGLAVAVAVAVAETGVLLSAETAFLTALSREWQQFDGRRVPDPLRETWRANPSFVHSGCDGRIEGRRAGTLVFLCARSLPDSGPLTRRQLQIARLFAEGFTHKQIARRCELAPATVRNHLAAAYDALGVHSRSELARRLPAHGASLAAAFQSPAGAD